MRSHEPRARVRDRATARAGRRLQRFRARVPTAATQGETIEEAPGMAEEAYLEVMHEDGLPIPTRHRRSVAVHAARSSRRVNGKQVIAAFEKEAWARQAGFAVAITCFATRISRTQSRCPSNGSRPLKRGTLASVLRAAGINSHGYSGSHPAITRLYSGTR